MGGDPQAAQERDGEGGEEWRGGVGCLRLQSSMWYFEIPQVPEKRRSESL